MFKNELKKASEKLNWDLQQQILILERFATYKNINRELNEFLFEKAEDDGYTVFDEGTTDVFDIAGEANWSAETLVENILNFLEEHSNKESFIKYVNICFHNK
tara:strand:- start:19474 stop:19782 length:309 start_codon:yes stop_codon:yes gene_type:complete